MGGPPVKEDVIKMGGSQIGFMKLFAIPLFSGITEVLSGMSFGIQSINKNRAIWEERVAAETERRSAVLQSPQAKPVQDTIKDIQRKTEVHAEELQNGRSESSTLAQLQPRSRASMSGPPSEKSSSHAAHLSRLTHISEQERRASLGPTVLPTKIDKPLRRSSGTNVSTVESTPDLTHQLVQPGNSKISPAERSDALVSPLDPTKAVIASVENQSTHLPSFDIDPSDPKMTESDARAREPFAIPMPSVQSFKNESSTIEVSPVKRRQSKVSLKFWRKKSREEDVSP